MLCYEMAVHTTSKLCVDLNAAKTIASLQHLSIITIKTSAILHRRGLCNIRLLVRTLWYNHCMWCGVTAMCKCFVGNLYKR
jgi:hypothetical protein